MVYSTDLRVKVSPTGLYTYPDIIVICDKSEFDDEHNDTLTNPMLIVEVLSKSTEDYDRGKKFENYRTLRSFKEYLLISQERHHIEHFVRQPNNRWLLSETNRLEETVRLASVNCELALSEIYDKINSL